MWGPPNYPLKIVPRSKCTFLSNPRTPLMFRNIQLQRFNSRAACLNEIKVTLAMSPAYSCSLSEACRTLRTYVNRCSMEETSKSDSCWCPRCVAEVYHALGQVYTPIHRPSPTTIPCWVYRFSSAHRSQAALGEGSTWMGDRLGTPHVVGISFVL